MQVGIWERFLPAVKLQVSRNKETAAQPATGNHGQLILQALGKSGVALKQQAAWEGEMITHMDSNTPNSSY